MLKSALLVRATADVKRIWRIKDDKAALTNLHARGLVGDDTMARFEAAEKELEAEIIDVVSEANTFRMGWGQMIFATASEMANAEKTRNTVLSIGKVKALEGKCRVLLCRSVHSLTWQRRSFIFAPGISASTSLKAASLLKPQPQAHPHPFTPLPPPLAPRHQQSRLHSCITHPPPITHPPRALSRRARRSNCNLEYTHASVTLSNHKGQVSADCPSKQRRVNVLVLACIERF